MIHHISFAVNSLSRSATFYNSTLSALNYVVVWADETAVGYGLPGQGDKFSIKRRTSGVTIPGSGFHVAFNAPSRDAVSAFYQFALENGGRDNGGCGLHP